MLQGEGGTIDSLFSSVGQLTTTLADRDRSSARTIDTLNAVLGPVDQPRPAARLARSPSCSGSFGARRRPRPRSASRLVSINDLASTTAGLLTSVRPDLKADIEQLGTLASKLSAPQSRKLITDFLKITPDKLKVTGPAAAYGCWLNYYLCAATLSSRTAPRPRRTSTPRRGATDAGAAFQVPRGRASRAVARRPRLRPSAPATRCRSARPFSARCSSCSSWRSPTGTCRSPAAALLGRLHRGRRPARG